MNKSQKIRLIIGLLINIAIFSLETYCLIRFIKYAIDGGSDNRFMYYTNISNLTVGALAFPNTILILLSLLRGEVIIPKWFVAIKFMGLTMTTLTFLVILCTFPFRGYSASYSGLKIITHLIVPVIAVVSFLFFEEKTLFKWKYSWLMFIPTAIYSTIYCIMVLVLGLWPDIYSINANGFWYLFVLLANVVSIGISEGLYFLSKSLRRI